MRRAHTGAAVTSLAAPKGDPSLAAGPRMVARGFRDRSWTGREVLRLPGAIQGLEVSTDGRWCAVATSPCSRSSTRSPGRKRCGTPIRRAPCRADRASPAFSTGCRERRRPRVQRAGLAGKVEIADDTRVERVANDDTEARIAVLTRRSGGGHDDGSFRPRGRRRSGNLLGWRYGSGNRDITHGSMLRLITERHRCETGGHGVVAASKAWTPLSIEPAEEFASADRRWVAKIVDNRLPLSRPGVTCPSAADQQSKISVVFSSPRRSRNGSSAPPMMASWLWSLNGSDLRSGACSRLKATLAPDAWATLAQSVATPTSTPICDSVSAADIFPLQVTAAFGRRRFAK